MIFFSHHALEVIWWVTTSWSKKTLYFTERFVIIIIFRDENVEDSDHGHLNRHATEQGFRWNSKQVEFYTNALRPTSRPWPKGSKRS